LKRLAELYPVRPPEEVARLLKRTIPAVKGTARRHGINKGRRLWSAAELKMLRKLYPNRPTQELARTFHRSVSALHGMAKKEGLKKSEKYLHSDECDCRLKKGSQIGKRFRFPKGHVPANKGIRRPGWYTGRMRETQFKKGHVPHTWRPVGTILVDGDGYLRIKVRERVPGDKQGWDSNVWPCLHHLVWMERRGGIPAGHMVIFKDRDRTNVKFENLELISMGDNARRNRMWGRLPPELCKAIQLNAVLKRVLRRLDGKKQNHGS
jgi:hypothetical protein